MMFRIATLQALTRESSSSNPIGPSWNVTVNVPSPGCARALCVDVHVECNCAAASAAVLVKRANSIPAWHCKHCCSSCLKS
eukprot:17193-Heterococcus_DN1.PRE.6